MVCGALVGTATVGADGTGAAWLGMLATVDNGVGSSGTSMGSVGSVGRCSSSAAMTATTPSVATTNAANAIVTGAAALRGGEVACAGSLAEPSISVAASVGSPSSRGSNK